jgi:hypothetical protein
MNHTILQSEINLGKRTPETTRKLLEKKASLEDIPEPVDYAHESIMRSKRMIRRYIRNYYNQDTRLVTLTFAEAVHDREAINPAIKMMAARWQSAKGTPLKALIIPELHPGGHGFHLHCVFFEADFNYDWFRVNIWKLGLIKASDPMRVRDVNSPHHLWSYLCKYLQKDLAWCPRYAHRYYRTGGLTPTWKIKAGRTLDALQTWRQNCAALDALHVPYHAYYTEVMPGKFIFFLEVNTGRYPELNLTALLFPKEMQPKPERENDYSALYQPKEVDKQNELPLN